MSFECFIEMVSPCLAEAFSRLVSIVIPVRVYLAVYVHWGWAVLIVKYTSRFEHTLISNHAKCNNNNTIITRGLLIRETLAPRYCIPVSLSLCHALCAYGIYFSSSCSQLCSIRCCTPAGVVS